MINEGNYCPYQFIPLNIPLGTNAGLLLGRFFKCRSIDGPELVHNDVFSGRSRGNKS